MFPKMRRFKQELSREDCEKLLRAATSGVLAVEGDDGYPYAVPLNYYYEDGTLIFHTAQDGHKMDALARNPKASFCVIARDDIVPEKYTSYFESVIAFGHVRKIEELDEKRAWFEKLAAKYSPEQVEGRAHEVERMLKVVCLLALDIEHLSGKESIELTRNRPQA